MFAEAWLAVTARDGTQVFEFAIFKSAALLGRVPPAKDAFSFDRILEVQNPLIWLPPLA